MRGLKKLDPKDRSSAKVGDYDGKFVIQNDFAWILLGKTEEAKLRKILNERHEAVKGAP